MTVTHRSKSKPSLVKNDIYVVKKMNLMYQFATYGEEATGSCINYNLKIDYHEPSFINSYINNIGNLQLLESIQVALANRSKLLPSDVLIQSRKNLQSTFAKTPVPTTTTSLLHYFRNLVNEFIVQVKLKFLSPQVKINMKTIMDKQQVSKPSDINWNGW